MLIEAFAARVPVIGCRFCFSGDSRARLDGQLCSTSDRALAEGKGGSRPMPHCSIGLTR
jgi:hypothetical protein